MSNETKTRQALAVVTVPGGTYSYVAVKMYTAVARLDGVYTWRAGETMSRHFRSKELAAQRAWELSKEMNLPVMEIKHGSCA